MSYKDENKSFTEAQLTWREINGCLGGKPTVVRLIGNSSGMLGLSSPIYGEDVYTADSRTAQYWRRARFLNATRRTLEALQGMVFSQKPEYEVGQLEYLEQNANGAGDSLEVVAQMTVEKVIALGRSLIVVDMPQVQGGLTLAQMEQGENAPRIIRYNPEDVFFWKERVINGVKVLCDIRVKECVEELQKDGISYKSVEYVRRFYLDADNVYHVDLIKDEKVIESNTPVQSGSVMNHLPCYFIGSNNNSAQVDYSPLADIAHINLGHFALDADNRDNLHYHGQGSLVLATDMDGAQFSEANPNGIDVGSKGSTRVMRGDSITLNQLQSTGAIGDAMAKDEQSMIMLGAQLVMGDTSQTLGAKKIEYSSSISVLRQIARNVSEALTQAMKECAKFAGANPDDLEFKLNEKFFADDITPQMIQQHFAMVQAGYLPASSLYEVSRKAGLTTLSDEEIEDETEGDESFMNASAAPPLESDDEE